MQVLPHKALTSTIKHYLFLDAALEETTKFRLFSDGNMGMVFSRQSQLYNSHPTVQSDALLPEAFFYGQSSSFREIYSQHQLSLIIVVFHPYGINRLLRLPASELQNTLLPVESVLGNTSLMLQEQLQERTQIADAVVVLDDFFLALQSGQSVAESLFIPATIDYILKQKGQTTVQQLVAYTGYSERHLERTFLNCIGMSPKSYLNLTRLHTFLNYLKRKLPEESFASLAYAAGYTDQAHLIREFKKYTGITPTDYAFKTQKLAINFMRTTEADLFQIL